MPSFTAGVGWQKERIVSPSFTAMIARQKEQRSAQLQSLATAFVVGLGHLVVAGVLRQPREVAREAGEDDAAGSDGLDVELDAVDGDPCGRLHPQVEGYRA